MEVYCVFITFFENNQNYVNCTMLVRLQLLNCK